MTICHDQQGTAGLVASVRTCLPMQLTLQESLLYMSGGKPLRLADSAVGPQTNQSLRCESGNAR